MWPGCCRLPAHVTGSGMWSSSCHRSRVPVQIYLFQISVTGGNHITRLRDSNRHQAVWCQDNATPPAQPELERSSQSPFYNLKLCLRSIKCCKGSHTCSQSQYQPTQFTNQIWCGLLTTAVLPCLLPTPPTDIQSDEPH